MRLSSLPPNDLRGTRGYRERGRVGGREREWHTTEAEPLNSTLLDIITHGRRGVCCITRVIEFLLVLAVRRIVVGPPSDARNANACARAVGGVLVGKVVGQRHLFIHDPVLEESP